MRRATAWLLALAFLAPLGGAQRVLAVQASDAPGTQITNSASATYKDASGNSYTTTSNVVTTIVQNAPSLTNTGGTGTNYAPGQLVSDAFVLTNTGNASGYFQLTGDATIAGTDAASASPGNGASTCATPVGTQPAPCKYAATVGATTYYFTGLSSTSDNNSLNYWLKNTNSPTAQSSAITVTVYYTLATNAATGSSNTVTSSIAANVSYAAAGSAPAEVSANQSATESNTVQADARLDLYKSSTQGGSGDITYTISAHDGGAFSAKDLQSVKALLTASSAGILLSDKVPQFGGSPLKLSGNGAVTVTTNASFGFASGATADVYYTTANDGKSGWTKLSGTSLPQDGSVTYIGIFIHGGSCSNTSGFEVCADTAHATNPGNANVASAAAVQFSFVVAQPAGSGAGNSGSVTNLANGVIGDNQPAEHVLGPGIPGGTADGSSSPLTASGQGINNTTQTSTGGASNQTSNQALASFNVLNGPAGQPGSTGSYDGSATSSTNADFTAASFGISADSITNTGTTAGTPVTTATTSAATTICVSDTIQNSGNKDDSYNVTAYAPTAFAIPATGGQSYTSAFNAGGTQVSTWTVGVYSNSSCSSALGGATSGSASSTASNVAVNSGSTLTFYVGYTAPAGVAYFTRFDSLVHATSVGDGSKTNDTHNELYSSFVALTKSQAITSTNCPTGASPSYVATTVCSGDAIAYTLDYRNLVLGTSDTNVSFNACTTQVGSGNVLTITDDGTVTSSSSSGNTLNNWGYFTTGLQATPVDKASSGSMRAGTSFAYATSTPHGTYGATFSAGATAFQVTPGGTAFSLVPKNYNSPSGSQDWQGTITFALTVK